jgi:CRISPR-associated endoribonuclease Cas6
MSPKRAWKHPHEQVAEDQQKQLVATIMSPKRAWKLGALAVYNTGHSERAASGMRPKGGELWGPMSSAVKIAAHVAVLFPTSGSNSPMPPELFACVLQLRPERTGTLPAFSGRLVQGWWLNHLEQRDPALSASLHSGSQLRPYACSDVHGVPATSSGQTLVVTPAQQLSIRIAAWDSSLVMQLLNLIIQPPAGLYLLGLPCAVTRISPDPESPATTFTELLARHALGTDVMRPPRDVTLNFLTATSFRQAATPLGRPRPLPFPLPYLVWGGLFDRWQEFSPIPLHPDLRDGLLTHAAVSRFEGMSSRVVLTGLDDTTSPRGRSQPQQIVGYVGSCTYYWPAAEPDLGRVAHLLAAFATFTGVGQGTTYGLGQVRAATG